MRARPLVRLALISGCLQQWRSAVLLSMSHRDLAQNVGRSSPTLKIFRPLGPMASSHPSMSDRDRVLGLLRLFIGSFS